MKIRIKKGASGKKTKVNQKSETQQAKKMTGASTTGFNLKDIEFIKTAI